MPIYYQQYPKATEVAPGRIVLRLWPKYTKSFGGVHWLDDCTRKGHDLSFRISSVSAFGSGVRSLEPGRRLPASGPPAGRLVLRDRLAEPVAGLRP